MSFLIQVANLVDRTGSEVEASRGKEVRRDHVTHISSNWRFTGTSWTLEDCLPSFLLISPSPFLQPLHMIQESGRMDVVFALLGIQYDFRKPVPRSADLHEQQSTSRLLGGKSTVTDHYQHRPNLSRFICLSRARNEEMTRHRIVSEPIQSTW